MYPTIFLCMNDFLLPQSIFVSKPNGNLFRCDPRQINLSFILASYDKVNDISWINALVEKFNRYSYIS